jgi:hypothetical protein
MFCFNKSQQPFQMGRERKVRLCKKGTLSSARTFILDKDSDCEAGKIVVYRVLNILPVNLLLYN